ncbi:hypothetical protein [Photobacterium damselae]|uniref:hypothetical protein n=1 Tax=Photobacterium damselae TaxID=38293 RepID=UPI00406926AC
MTKPNITLLLWDSDKSEYYIKTLLHINEFYQYGFFSRLIAPDFYIGSKLPDTQELQQIIDTRSFLLSEFVNSCVKQVNGDNSLVSYEVFSRSVSHFLVDHSGRKFIPVLKRNSNEILPLFKEFLSERGGLISSNPTEIQETYKYLSQSISSANSSLVLSSTEVINRQKVINYLSSLNSGKFDEVVIDIYCNSQSQLTTEYPINVIEQYSLVGSILKTLI